MPGFKFATTKDKLEISAEQEDYIKTEINLLKKSLAASSLIFKTRLQSLIDGLTNRNVSPEQVLNVLLDDFDNNGPIFGGLQRGIQDSLTSTIGNIESRIPVEEWENERSGQLYTWIAALVNTCADCLPLHGVSKTYEEWESDPGLPRSGWSVCRGSCQCILLPESVAQGKEELQEPIKRAKKIITDIAKEKDVANVNDYVNRKLGRIRNTQDNLRPEYRKELPGFKK